MRRVSRYLVVIGTLVAAGTVAIFALSATTPPTRSADDVRSAAPSHAVIAAEPTRVILTPTATPSRSQSFSWLAGDMSHTAGSVQIRSTGGDVLTVAAYDAGTVNNNPLRHFSATASGLEPATTYEYRVGFEGSWSRWREFSTADPTENNFQFIYFGDAQIGLDTTWPSVVKQAEEAAPDAAGSVHAGDLINSANDETEWVNWFTGMGNLAATTNVMAAPGTHEYINDPHLKAWKANFEYPHNNPTTETSGALAELAVGDSDVARQYAAYFAHWSSFAAETVYFTDYQGVRFVTLNASQDVDFLTPPALPTCNDDRCPSHRAGEVWIQFQASWLDQVLSESPATWNVITFHEPVYSVTVGRDEPILRANWVPIFEKHNVDLVMMGHDHAYARGFNDDDLTSVPGVTDGPVYIVSNSGAKHYVLTPAEENVWTMNGATQVRRGGGVTTYQVIDVSEDQLVYRSYLAEKTADSTTSRAVGAVFDEFTITKTLNGTKWVTEAGVDPPR